MAAPIITLTTDFGVRDPFVAIMKGVILGICRDARLVDVTHEVAPCDVAEACLSLESSVDFFPPGTIHLAVVDPGVGSGRRGIALRAGEQYFVGPDNGLFSFAISGSDWTAVSLERDALRRPAVSRTFHGRDIFAPAAAYLAAGVPLERFGPPVTDPERLIWPACRLEGGELVGEVIGSDRFGNLLTNVRADDLDLLGTPDRLVVSVSGRDLGGPVACYADGPTAAPSPIIGSSGRLEIFANRTSARALLGVASGDPVRVRRAG